MTKTRPVPRRNCCPACSRCFFWRNARATDMPSLGSGHPWYEWFGTRFQCPYCSAAFRLKSQRGYVGGKLFRLAGFALFAFSLFQFPLLRALLMLTGSLFIFGGIWLETRCEFEPCEDEPER